MSSSSSKEVILKKIRKALSESTPLPFPQNEGLNSLYQSRSVDTEHDTSLLEIQFAEEFSKVQGKFAFCIDKEDLAAQIAQLTQAKTWSKLYCSEDPLQQMLKAGGFAPSYYNDLSDCDVSITSCESLVARTGSIVLSAALQTGRTASVYAPIHICIAFTHQLVYDVKDALQRIKEKYGTAIPSSISFATGPSRTADIEKTLVTGVHGPKEVYVFLTD